MTNKIPGPTSYVKLLDEVMLRRTAAQKPGMPIRPSNAGSCARKMAYEYLGYLGKIPVKVEERKPSVERLLSLGHFVEDHLVQDLKEVPDMSVRFTQQLVEMFTLPGGLTVEGSTDAVTWSDEIRGVLDVKSIGDRWHAAFSSKWDGLLDTYRNFAVEFDTNSFFVDDLHQFLLDIGTDDSLYKNLVQLNLYACCDFLQKRGVDHASIIRYNKNNSQLMEIRFVPDMRVFEQTKERLSLVEKAGLEGDIEIAPKERVLGQLDCAYCLYKANCWPKAQKKDFYSNGKKYWATRTSELEKGTDLEALFLERERLEKEAVALVNIDREIIKLIDGHGVSKIKLDNGAVYEVKLLQKEAVLRRSKE